MTRNLVLSLAALGLVGCASIVSGTSQNIYVNTTPEGADCKLYRENVVIARANPTPATVKVDKTKHDITIKCNKDGYQESTYINESGNEGATLGNIILGGGIGWAVDSAAGADNKYQEKVHINLSR